MQQYSRRNIMAEVSTGKRDYQQQQEKESVAAGINSNSRLMKNLLINLPEDMLINYILLKVPIKSLLNLRCVCNSLRSLITSPDFVKMHLHLTITVNNELVLVIPSYVPLDLNRDPSEKPTQTFYSLNFNATDDPSSPERTEITTPFRSPRIFGSCNGLLCLSEKDSRPDGLPVQNRWISTYSSPCIWNPTTKEYKELPTPSIQNPFGETRTSSIEHRSICYSFGYDKTIDDYKVIRCETFTSSEDRDPITEFQVYTMGTNTWRSISTCNSPYRSYYLTCKRQGLFVNGAFHWIMYAPRKLSSNPSRQRAKIISLDIVKEEFRELQPPHYRLNKRSSWDIQILRGCLCIDEDVGYMDPGSKIDVWLMNEDSVWTKLFKIVEPALAFPDLYRPACIKLLRFMENGEILISINSKLLVLYDPVTDTDRRIDKLADIPGPLSFKGNYIESLVSLKSGIYRC